MKKKKQTSHNKNWTIFRLHGVKALMLEVQREHHIYDCTTGCIDCCERIIAELKGRRS